MNTKRAPGVDTSMRYVACAVMLGVLAEACGGAEFQEELFGNAPSGMDAASVDVGVETDASVALDALGTAKLDAASDASDASAPDACDCTCLSSIDPAYCADGGVWRSCQNTPQGPIVTCVYLIDGSWQP